MTNRLSLELAVQIALDNLAYAQRTLAEFDDMPENNQFLTLEIALGKIEDKLEKQANEDCEGSYNCGNPEYTQKFMVRGIMYTGKLTCEYNRHDKTYYYVEESEFTYSVDE